jgi:hypothetical protein
VHRPRNRTHAATSLVLAMAAAMTLLGGAAEADIVRPPPENCPTGSSGQTGHSGPYCAPRKCTADSACAKGERCEARKLCVKSKTLGGGRRIRKEPPPTVEEVVGTCAGGSKCAAGSCTSLRVCVPKGGK